MRNQRGSATIMAITVMLVLMAGAAAYTYSTGRNVSVTVNYENGLKAQYASESAVNVAVAAARESIKMENGWASGKPSWIDVWANRHASSGAKLQMTLPDIGVADIECFVQSEGKYRVQAVAKTNDVTRLAYAKDIDLLNNITTNAYDVMDTVSTADLIRGGRISAPINWDGSIPANASELVWRLPGVDDKVSPALSPDSMNVYTQVLFKDLLGMPTFKPNSDGSMSTLFKINYYIRLAQYDSNQDTGYGIYYLAQKYYDPVNKVWDTGNPDNPRAYVVQFDPGIWDWDNGRSPDGAFLVKKVIPPSLADTADSPNRGPIPSRGWDYETWDYPGAYDALAAFQKNADVDQYWWSSSDQCWYANPYDVDLTPVRGMQGFGTAIWGSYNSRPGNYHVMFALGDVAEGNVWEANARYCAGAKVTAGGKVLSDPSKRLVYVAQNEGTTGASKPRFPTTVGATVRDGEVTWKARYVPTSKEIAAYILRTGVSIVKISMADLKARIDLINGTASVANPYVAPFDMKTKNKITIEFLVDGKGNRVHIVRVNDVVALAFNDTDTNVVPAGWENKRGVAYEFQNSSSAAELKQVVATSELGTGIRVWGAIAEFYTVDNYGQRVVTSQSVASKIGLWGY